MKAESVSLGAGECHLFEPLVTIVGVQLYRRGHEQSGCYKIWVVWVYFVESRKNPYPYASC